MDLVYVGNITKPQGIKGELKVSSASLYLFEKGLKVFIDNKEYEIESVKDLNDGIILKLSSISTRNDSELYRGKKIFMDRENIHLNEEEYLAEDLMGYIVKTKEGKELGKLDAIINYGSTDVYYVKGERDFSFPALKMVITKFDTINSCLVVDEEKLMEVILYEN